MTVRCGNHGWNEHVYHEDAAEVRACFAGRQDFDDQAKAEPTRTDTFGPDSGKLEAYWDQQMQDKERREDEAVAEYKDARDRKLARQPVAPVDQDQTHATSYTLERVWEGAYALEDPTDGKLRFIEVDKPDKDRWQGWTFVKVRASDELHKLGSVNPHYGTYKGKAVALVGVLAGADTHELEQYAIRFGMEIGECGFCRRSLTDEDSRGLGYGPVCAGRRGLPHPRARAS